MSATAEKTDPKLWDKVKAEITSSDKGGRPGQWSARKAQLAVHDYKAAGGRYKGGKSADNHLVGWTEEQWGTRSGEKSRDTGERYLPKEARDALTPAEYSRTTAKKRRDTRAGKQFSAQPEDVAEKTAEIRRHAHQDTAPAGETRADLYRRAQQQDVRGRSRMTKDQLRRALAR